MFALTDKTISVFFYVFVKTDCMSWCDFSYVYLVPLLCVSKLSGLSQDRAHIHRCFVGPTHFSIISVTRDWEGVPFVFSAQLSCSAVSPCMVLHKWKFGCVICHYCHSGRMFTLPSSATHGYINITAFLWMSKMPSLKITVTHGIRGITMTVTMCKLNTNMQ